MARSNKTYEVIDLFCGIGGLSYGLKCQGMKILAGFDLDYTCQYAYETNTGGKFYYRDVKTISGDEINKLYSQKKNVIKVLAGCAPCQPFSSYAIINNIENLSPEEYRERKKQFHWEDKFGIYKPMPDGITEHEIKQLIKQKKGE